MHDHESLRSDEPTGTEDQQVHTVLELRRIDRHTMAGDGVFIDHRRSERTAGDIEDLEGGGLLSVDHHGPSDIHHGPGTEYDQVYSIIECMGVDSDCSTCDS